MNANTDGGERTKKNEPKEEKNKRTEERRDIVCSLPGKMDGGSCEVSAVAAHAERKYLFFINYKLNFGFDLRRIHKPPSRLPVPPRSLLTHTSPPPPAIIVKIPSFRLLFRRLHPLQI